MIQKCLCLVFFLLSFVAIDAQTIKFSASTPFTDGPPSGAPTSSGSRYRFDLNTNRVYTWNGTTWLASAQGFDVIVGASVPLYVPGRGQSEFAINASNEIYRYTGGVWVNINSMPYRVPAVSSFSNATFYNGWATGRVVETEGFYTAGDGGGANYIIEASGTVDNISVFAVGSRRARVIANEDGGINILQLGAKPDDATDDRSFIQKALDLFPLVYCESVGRFRIDAKLRVPQNRHIRFGKSTEIALYSSVQNCLLMNADTNGVQKNLIIEGGIWNMRHLEETRNTVTSTFGGQALMGIFLFRWQNVIIRDISVINCAKYAIYPCNMTNFVVDNVRLNTYSDGIHVSGPGKNIEINNVHGKSGDDFVIIDGSNWSPYTISEGDFESVKISNIVGDTAYGNIVVVFPGNKNSGGVIQRNYVVKNITIDGVYGHSLIAKAVGINSSGSLLTPGEEGTVGGIIRNCVIRNVYGKAISSDQMLLSIDSIYNLKIENVFSQRNGDAIVFTSDPETGTWMDQVAIDGYYTNVPFTGSRPINIVAGVEIEELNLNNINTEVNGTLSHINLSNLAKTTKYNITNSILKGTNGYLDFRGTNSSLNLTNVEISGGGVGVEVRGVGNTVHLNDVFFNNKTFGVVAYDASTTVDVFANKYRHTGGLELNTFRELTVGARLKLKNNSENREVKVISLGDYTLQPQYVEGSIIEYVNNHPSNPRTIFASAGETVDGGASVQVAFRNGVRILKTGATTWKTLSNPNTADLGNLAAVNYWTEGSGHVWRPSGNVGIGTTLSAQQVERLNLRGSQPFIRIGNTGFGDNATPQRAGIKFYGAGDATEYGRINILDRTVNNGFGQLDFGVSDGTVTIQTALSLNGNGLTVTAPSWAGTGNGLLQASSTGVSSRIDQTGITTGQALVWNGTNWLPTTTTIKATSTLNFPSTSAASSSDLTVTVTGAVVGDGVIVAPDPASVLANSNYTAWVSATNTVTVRFATMTLNDPASGSFKIIVTKY
jgi:hypothetical protein